MAAATLAERATTLIAQMGGLMILAGTLAAVAAVVYRWYVRDIVPRGLSLLIGLSGVAVYLNTTTALGQVIAGSTAPTDAEQALFNIAAFIIAGGGAVAGRRIGDQFGTDVLLSDGVTDVDDDVGRLVQSVGRVISVELPKDIDDVTGYDPVPAETKSKLAGRTFLFPKRLTVTELRERLVHRLKTDYAVGHVDVELADDGSIEFFALGSRAAGIGPTLPPATNAVAIRADPAFAASAGDLVQVWSTNPMRRVLTAELRGVADETVTIAIDAADTPKIDPTATYRLVTLPVTDRPDREFASLLRAAAETFSSVTVQAGSPLHGLPVGALDLAVVAVQHEDGSSMTLPERVTILAPGDTVFAIARPDVLRRLERAAEPLDPSLVSRPSTRAANQHPPQETTATKEQLEDSVDATADETTATESDAVDSTPETSETVADDGEATTEAADDTPEQSDGTSGQADAGLFQDLKDEFDSGEAEWDDSDTEEDSGPPAGESDTAGDDDQSSDEPNRGTRDTADAESFQDLKAEFDSGDAEWAEVERPDDAPEETTERDSSEVVTDALVEDDESLDELDEAQSTDSGDDLFGENSGLEDVTFDDESDDDGGEDELSDDDLFGDDAGLDDVSFDDADDDLAALGGDGGEELTLDDNKGGDVGDEDDADADEANDDDEDDDKKDNDNGGGGTSFQQLKEEFESGDADWEDDISDSPGGDMRLDE